MEHDPAQLSRALLNVLLNAIQSMQQPGTIDVSVERVPGDPMDIAMVCIADTGRGIHPANLDRIFRPFFTTRKGSTGMGLALARRILRAMAAPFRRPAL